MRDYQAHSEEIEAAGGTLVVLTNDSPEVLAEVKDKEGFDHSFVHATAETWASWGLQHDKRAELPYPTTFVVAPDGTLVYREIHVNHMKRAHVDDIVARVAAWSAGAFEAAPEPVEPEPETQEHVEPEAPDWDNAVHTAAWLEEGRLVVELQVGEGFHVYGANETISRPLVVAIEQLPDLVMPIPTGEEKELGEALGTAWVLEGQVQLSVELPPDAPAELSGTLDYQVCTNSACTAPTYVEWTAGVEDER